MAEQTVACSLVVGGIPFPLKKGGQGSQYLGKNRGLQRAGRCLHDSMGMGGIKSDGVPTILTACDGILRLIAVVRGHASGHQGCHFYVRQTCLAQLGL